MHIWASKTQKLPGPLSGPWTPATDCLLCFCDSALLHQQLLTSEAGPALDQILDPHLVLVMWCNILSCDLTFSFKGLAAYLKWKTKKHCIFCTPVCQVNLCYTDQFYQFSIGNVMWHWNDIEQYKNLAKSRICSCDCVILMSFPVISFSIISETSLTWV